MLNVLDFQHLTEKLGLEIGALIRLHNSWRAEGGGKCSQGFHNGTGSDFLQWNGLRELSGSAHNGE